MLSGGCGGWAKLYTSYAPKQLRAKVATVKNTTHGQNLNVQVSHMKHFRKHTLFLLVRAASKRLAINGPRQFFALTLHKLCSLPSHRFEPGMKHASVQTTLITEPGAKRASAPFSHGGQVNLTHLLRYSF